MSSWCLRRLGSTPLCRRCSPFLPVLSPSAWSYISIVRLPCSPAAPLSSGFSTRSLVTPCSALGYVVPLVKVSLPPSHGSAHLLLAVFPFRVGFPPCLPYWSCPFPFGSRTLARHAAFARRPRRTCLLGFLKLLAGCLGVAAPALTSYASLLGLHSLASGVSLRPCITGVLCPMHFGATAYRPWVVHYSDILILPFSTSFSTGAAPRCMVVFIGSAICELHLPFPSHYRALFASCIHPLGSSQRSHCGAWPSARYTSNLSCAPHHLRALLLRAYRRQSDTCFRTHRPRVIWALSDIPGPTRSEQLHQNPPPSMDSFYRPHSTRTKFAH